MFMRLKSQRQLLIIALAFACVLCMTLLALTLVSDSTKSVKLGKGWASVETLPVTEFEAQPIRVPAPTPSASHMPGGHASYYGHELAGNLTASGEVFDPNRLTAAHRTLPIGSRVRVTNPVNGNSVIVRINDRGPFHGNRVIDLSYGAAREIGLIRSGTGRVQLALLVRA